MNNKFWLIAAALALTACQADKTKPATVISAPTPVAEVATPAVVASAVVATPVAEAVAPVVVQAPAPVAAVAAPVSPVPAVVTPVAAKPAAPAITTPTARPVAPVVVAKPDPVVATPAKPQAAVVAVASEAEAVALAKKRGCFACHSIQNKIVGPAWKDVAAKYRGDAGAQARLEAKVAKGGSGVWGTMAMPAQTQATDADRALLVRFVLNLK